MRQAQNAYNASLVPADVANKMWEYVPSASQPISAASLVTSLTNLYIQATNRFSLLLLVGAAASVVISTLQMSGTLVKDKTYNPEEHYFPMNFVKTYILRGQMLAMPSKDAFLASLYGKKNVKTDGAPMLNEAKANLASIAGSVLSAAVYAGMNYAQMSEGYKSLALGGMVLSLFAPAIYTRVSAWWNKVPEAPLSETEKQQFVSLQKYFNAMTQGVTPPKTTTAENWIAATKNTHMELALKGNAELANNLLAVTKHILGENLPKDPAQALAARDAAFKGLVNHMTVTGDMNSDHADLEITVSPDALAAILGLGYTVDKQRIVEAEAKHTL